MLQLERQSNNNRETYQFEKHQKKLVEILKNPNERALNINKRMSSIKDIQ